MKLSRIDKVVLLLLVLIFAFAFYIYPSMPERVPTHWNAAGEIDGYGNRFMGVFFFPIVIVAVYLLFLFIPKMAVYKKNIADFEKYFEGMKFVFFIYFFAVYVVTLLPMFGIIINMTYFMVPAIAILFYYIGYIMQFVKRNYFIGIRTPWALADEKVWDKTHKLGSITFRANAVILLFTMINEAWFFWIFIGSILVNIVALFVYSYVEWKKIERK